MGGGIVILFILILALIIGGAIYSAIAAKKRREELFMLAARLGLNFNPAEDHELAKRFGFLDKLAQGSNRYAFNVISGAYRQNQVLVFDYHYETQSTDSKGNTTTNHHYFSFFILLLPMNFPDSRSPARACFPRSPRRSATRTSTSSRQSSPAPSACGPRTRSSPTTCATRR